MDFKAGCRGPLTRARATMTATDDGKAAYLFGGQGYYTLLNDLWQLKASNLTWTQLKPGGAQPAERHGHIGFSSGGMLVIGQGEGYYALREDWYTFDPQENAWEARGTAHATAQAGCGRDRCDHRFDVDLRRRGLQHAAQRFVADGNSGQQAGCDAKVLDLNTLPPVTNACALANGGQLWLTGGQSYYKIVPERWQLDLSTGKSTSSPLGYASTGAICLRRKDGQAQWLLGQGFYEMSQVPLIFSTP